MSVHWLGGSKEMSSQGVPVRPVWLLTFPLAMFGFWKLTQDWRRYRRDRDENRLPSEVLRAERLRFRGVAGTFVSALLIAAALINPTSPVWLFWVLGALAVAAVLTIMVGSFLAGWRRA
jgi:hypothetical protein